MSDPFAPSSDPDIPTPTRSDLLPLVHGSVRDQLYAGTLDAQHAENEWRGARRQWDEGHKRDAARRAEEEAISPQVQNIKLSIGGEKAPPDIGIPLVDGEPSGMPRDVDSEFTGTFGDVLPSSIWTRDRWEPRPFKESDVDEGIGMAQPTQAPEGSEPMSPEERAVFLDSIGQTNHPDNPEPPDTTAQVSIGVIEGRDHTIINTFAVPSPSQAVPSPSQMEKFWKFTDSNLLWGGGVGLAFIAYAFEWASVPPKVTVTMLVMAWLIISVSIWRHRFFEQWPRTLEMTVNGFISLLVAGMIVIGWLAFQPSPVSPKADASIDSQKSNDIEQRVFIDVEPTFLIDLFKKYNALQAEEIVKPYIGKWMRFSGTVSNVTRNRDKPETVTMSILPDPYEISTAYVVNAEFSDQRWMVRSSVMQRGEKVTVIGQIQSVIEPGIMLNNAEIIEGK